MNNIINISPSTLQNTFFVYKKPRVAYFSTEPDHNNVKRKINYYSQFF